MKPMLAATVEDVATLRYPLLASPKLDGIRIMVRDATVLSRNMKLIPNNYVQHLFGRTAYNGMDGEAIVGDPTADDCFRATTSGIMSVDGEPDVRFFAFDNYDYPHMNFKARLRKLRGGLRVQHVEHYDIDGISTLEQFEEDCLRAGYEGVMLRDPLGGYKFGRSTLKEGLLMKLKRFCDSEAEVIGWEEQQHNGNEATLDALGRTKRTSHKAGKTGKRTLGALLVRDVVSGVEFNIGTGFDDATRAELWAHIQFGAHPLIYFTGKLVKYRYFPTGSKTKPRFPTFLGFRHPDDMS